MLHLISTNLCSQFNYTNQEGVDDCQNTFETTAHFAVAIGLACLSFKTLQAANRFFSFGRLAPQGSGRIFQWMVTKLDGVGEFLGINNKCGKTALMFAIENGDRSILQRIFMHERIDVDQTDQVGRTALYYALASRDSWSYVNLREIGCEFISRSARKEIPVESGVQGTFSISHEIAKFQDLTKKRQWDEVLNFLNQTPIDFQQRLSDDEGSKSPMLGEVFLHQVFMANIHEQASSDLIERVLFKLFELGGPALFESPYLGDGDAIISASFAEYIVSETSFNWLIDHIYAQISHFASGVRYNLMLKTLVSEKLHPSFKYKLQRRRLKEILDKRVELGIQIHELSRALCLAVTAFDANQEENFLDLLLMYGANPYYIKPNGLGIFHLRATLDHLRGYEKLTVDEVRQRNRYPEILEVIDKYWPVVQGVSRLLSSLRQFSIS